MKDTNIPGFTAEASLYNTNELYFQKVTNTAPSNHVVPQIPIGLCNKAVYYCNRGIQKWCDIADRFCFGDF